MADSRCGHVAELTTIEGKGAVCCWRPVWEDRERCIWHADEAGKPRGVLEDHAPERGERLDGAVLRDAPLAEVTWLAEQSLVRADLSGADLSRADLSGADLRRAELFGVDADGATFVDANLEDADLTEADLRGADLSGALTYRAQFEDVRVNRATDFGEQSPYDLGVDADVDPAMWTYQTFERVFEANALTRLSYQQYVRKKDVQRRAAWRARAYFDALRLEGARFVTGYGRSPTRVIAVSALVILLAAVVYPLTGGLQPTATENPITYRVRDPTEASRGWLLVVFLESLYFSVVTFATLGYGDIQPIGAAARALAGAEALAGSLLMALFVFVLTRSVW